jgi:hypothetical protein
MPACRIKRVLVCTVEAFRNVRPKHSCLQGAGFQYRETETSHICKVPAFRMYCEFVRMKLSMSSRRLYQNRYVPCLQGAYLGTDMFLVFKAHIAEQICSVSSRRILRNIYVLCLQGAYCGKDMFHVFKAHIAEQICSNIYVCKGLRQRLTMSSGSMFAEFCDTKSARFAKFSNKILIISAGCMLAEFSKLSQQVQDCKIFRQILTMSAGCRLAWF